MTGETPLHYAVRKENIKLVRILMENGADPTIKATDGKTPIDVASENNVNSEVLDCLQCIFATLLHSLSFDLFDPLLFPTFSDY